MIFIGLNNNLFMICVSFSLLLRALYMGFSNIESLLLALNVALLGGFVKTHPLHKHLISSYVRFLTFHLGLIQIAFVFHPKSYLTCSLNGYEKLHVTNLYLCDIPQTEEPGGLQSMELQRIRHDLATKQQQQLYSYNSIQLLYSYLENPLERGAQ